MGDGILPFDRGDSSSTLSKEALLLASGSVASTDVLSTPMSGSVIEDCAAADGYCSWRILLFWLANLDQPGGCGAALLRRYGVAGFLDGTLEILGGHRTLVVGDLDGALLDVGVGSLHPGESVKLALYRGLAVAAAHALHI